MRPQHAVALIAVFVSIASMSTALVLEAAGLAILGWLVLGLYVVFGIGLTR